MFGRHKQRQRIIESWIDGLNSRDFSAIEPLVAPDCLIIDSRGDAIEGREDCLEAMRRFFELEPAFRIYLDRIETTATETLMRGSASASDPRLARDTLWRARSDEHHLLEWQSFSACSPIGLAHILMGDKVQRMMA